VGFTCACAEKVEEETFKKKSFSIFQSFETWSNSNEI
jgi:hypothetical protein